MLHKAYCLLSVKSLDEEQRLIRGMATTPTPDRGDDVVEPFGVKFRNPLPFILHHDKKSPVGDVYFDAPTAAGIPFTARIPHVKEAGIVRDRVDEAWHSAKYGLLKGVSIGYLPLKAIPRRTGGQHLKEIEVVELSMVAVPMNAETTITAIKSLDASYLAASGTGSELSPQPAGVSASLRKAQRSAGTMTISEQLTGVKADLQTKSARLEELMANESTEGGLEENEVKELDDLTGEVKTLTTKAARLEALEAAQAQNAKVVSFSAPSGQKVVAHNPAITVTDHAKELPKGTLFTRYAMAKAAGKGSLSDTLEYAKRWNAQTPEVTAYIKAEAGSSVAASPGWGSELVYQNNLASEFVELLRPQTIIGRIEGFRNVPFNVRIPVQSGGSTVNWVGEKAPKPVTELDFTTLTVPYHKIAGIIVLTDELVRLSSPSAEATVRRDLVDQISQFMDAQFIQVAITAGANNPASITNGVASPAASSTTLAALYADLNTALATFDTANIPTDGLVIVTTPAVARILSLMITSLGQPPAGFNVTPQGGTLLGYPVVVSSSVDAGTLIIFKPSEIFLADDGRVTLDASNQATLDMAGGSTPDFNLWQKNCTAIRAERWITWVKRRTGVVAIIDTIAYVPGT